MYRRVSNLRHFSALLLAFGCSTSAGGLGNLPSTGGGTGGTTSTDTSTTTTGGAPASTGGAGSVGGSTATGGTTAVQTTGESTGGATGVVTATGGSTGIASGAIVLSLTLSQNGGSKDPSQGTLLITPAVGAAPTPASSMKLTLCGAGSGTIINTSSMVVNDARLVCPSDNPPVAGCSNPGQNVQLTGSAMPITITGIPASCCYNFDLTGVTQPLAAGGRIEIHYQMGTNNGGVPLQGANQIWSALINGTTAAQCKIGASPTYAVTCS